MVLIEEDLELYKEPSLTMISVIFILIPSLNGSNGSYTNTDDHDYDQANAQREDRRRMRARTANFTRFRGHNQARNDHPDIGGNPNYDFGDPRDPANEQQGFNPGYEKIRNNIWTSFFDSGMKLYTYMKYARESWIESFLDPTIKIEADHDRQTADSLLAKEHSMNSWVAAESMDDRDKLNYSIVKEYGDLQLKHNMIIRDDLETMEHQESLNRRKRLEEIRNDDAHYKQQIRKLDFDNHETKTQLGNQELRVNIEGLGLVNERRKLEIDINRNSVAASEIQNHILNADSGLKDLELQYETDTYDNKVLNNNILTETNELVKQGKELQNLNVNLRNQKLELDIEYKEPLLSQEVTTNALRIQSQRLALQLDQRALESRLERTILETQMQASLLETNNLKNQQLQRLVAVPERKEPYQIEEGLLFSRYERTCCQIMTSCCVYNVWDSTQVDGIVNKILSERERNYSAFKRFLVAIGISHSDYMYKQRYSRMQRVDYYPELTNILVNHFAATTLGQHTFTAMWARCKSKQEFADRLPNPSAIGNVRLQNSVLIAQQVLSYMQEQRLQYSPLN